MCRRRTRRKFDLPPSLPLVLSPRFFLTSRFGSVAKGVEVIRRSVGVREAYVRVKCENFDASLEFSHAFERPSIFFFFQRTYNLSNKIAFNTKLTIV